ncbi:semaphorin-2A-like protein [Dinothrombium tinctorium]|uniref:Semaphorin-2A-like protein n=1 Tax=Dinothrombium tinctorium TaxID=1965070 RepID=A0A3S3SNP3_9ACAR|nr:semaphorin-2A-like protein [Dinothrombium tinctorium]RWS17870.1 semaphorin-2A-like protein [Dinothrombium tinctorium]
MFIKLIFALFILLSPSSCFGYRHGQWAKHSVVESQHALRHHRDHIREFSCGKLHYRIFHLDTSKDVLYVGAMDKIFRLNLNNINRTRCEVFEMRGEVVNCETSDDPYNNPSSAVPLLVRFCQHIDLSRLRLRLRIDTLAKCANVLNGRK